MFSLSLLRARNKLRKIPINLLIVCLILSAVLTNEVLQNSRFSLQGKPHETIITSLQECIELRRRRCLVRCIRKVRFQVGDKMGQGKIFNDTNSLTSSEFL